MAASDSRSVQDTNAPVLILQDCRKKIIRLNQLPGLTFRNDNSAQCLHRLWFATCEKPRQINVIASQVSQSSAASDFLVPPSMPSISLKRRGQKEIRPIMV